jgi:HlyD family secretion protein
MARSEVANARASLGMIEARASDLVLQAPVSGRIQSRQAEPGEQLPAGVPALTLGETARPYVRVYVPASRLGEVRVRDTIVVTPEGQQTPGGRGIVVAINSKAEFTPRVALTEQERADLMFGVKVDLLAPFEGFHPGLWVRADFSTRRGGGETSRR